MAQIIKHRRGGIGTLKDVTARVGEFVMATGSINDLNGPMVFIGETEGVAGAYRPVSKIFQGSTAPTISVGSYGSVIDGTPFYATGNKTLYILSKDGNSDIDLTGNIEGNTISGLTINKLTGTLGLDGDLNMTGNTYQTGSITLTGDVTLRGNINIGDNLTGDTVNINGEISSSLIPAINNTFDLGSADNAWNDLYVSGTAYIETLNLESIQLNSLDLPGTLTVTGQTILKGGLVTTGSFSVDGSATVNNTLTVTGTTTIHGDETVNGILTVTGNTQLGGNLYVSGNLEVLGTSTNVNIESSTVNIGDNIIQVNAYSPFDRYAGLSAYDSGSAGLSGSFLWDAINDYWLVQYSNGNTGKIVSVTTGSMGSETSLTDGTFPIATSNGTIGNSLLTYNGTTLALNTNKFSVDSGTGDATITGNLTLSYSGGTDNALSSSAIVFRNSSNILGYVSTTSTTDVMDGILGYKNSNGALVFSTVIDGGSYV
jgi:hypothetical protein